MNDKQKELNRLVDIAVSCCSTEIDGKNSVKREDVLGTCRCENAVMTRCILVALILHSGYSVSTAAFILNRTEHGIKHLERLHDNYAKTSRAYRIALAEAVLKVRDVEPGGV